MKRLLLLSASVLLRAFLFCPQFPLFVCTSSFHDSPLSLGVVNSIPQETAVPCVERRYFFIFTGRQQRTVDISPDLLWQDKYCSNKNQKFCTAYRPEKSQCESASKRCFYSSNSASQLCSTSFETEPFSIFPGSTLPSQLVFKISTVFPIPLPPDVAKGITVFP